MKRICISNDWWLKAPGEKDFKKIDLPNDYSVTMPRDPNANGGASTGYFPDGVGRYVKYLPITDVPQHYLLDVDGAYMCTSVELNEYHLTMHPHGYTPFLVDLTPRIKFGETNKLAVTTNGMQPSTRWYSGAGIYRDVFLWTGGEIRLEPRDVFVTTPTLQDVRVNYCVTADRAGTIELESRIFDRDGELVLSQQRELDVASGKTSLELEFTIENAECWEPGHPYLYTIQTILTENGREIDKDERRFGIRTISADAKNGLLLNGKPIKLRGGCIHHDHGVLGAADYPAACYRKLSRLQAAGFNALRIAHNPPSRTLLDFCDEMGILVMDEFFDMWQKMKGGNLNYHLWFADWWQRDIESAVLRDRDHPCVISYSVGNEIPESNGTSDGGEWTRRLAQETRKHDATRLLTSAVWGVSASPETIDPPEYKTTFEKQYITPEFPTAEEEKSPNWAGRTKDYYAPLDICGYNYLYQRYEMDHEIFPDRVIWGSETHALNFFDSWHQVLKHPYVIGDFTWTAYDNLGEAGTGRSCWARDGEIKGISLAEYPWRSCYQGDLDLCGYRRPQSYFREAVWIGNTEPRIFTTHPEHYGEGFSGTQWHWYDVLDSWTFDDAYLGKPVKCEVYTDADEIEWYCNGRKLGRSVPEKAIATFTIPYEKGEIAVIAYRGGKEYGRSSLSTVGMAANIQVTPETESIQADGRDLCYFDIFVTDESGNRIPDARCELICRVDGGELLGIFSGDPANEDSYGSDRCHAFEGRAVAIVCTKTPGTVTVTVISKGLTDGCAEVSSRLVETENCR